MADNVELEMFTFHCLRQMQKKGTLCDLVLISRDWKEYKVHSLVIVAVSKSFYNLCTEQGSLKKLRLMNVSGYALGLLVRFLYGENLSNMEDLKHLSQTLKKIGMKDLFQFIGTSLCHSHSSSGSDISAVTNDDDPLKESKERDGENCSVEDHSKRPDQTRGGNSENVDSGKELKTLTVTNYDGSLKPLGLFINKAHNDNHQHHKKVETTITKGTFEEQEQNKTYKGTATATLSLEQNEGETITGDTLKSQKGMFFFDKKYALVMSKPTDQESRFVKVQIPDKSPSNISPTKKSLNKKMQTLEKLGTPLNVIDALKKKLIPIKPQSKTTQELLLVSNCLSGLPVSQTIKQETDITGEMEGERTNDHFLEHQKYPQPKAESNKSKPSSNINQLKRLCKPAIVCLSRIPNIKPGQRLKVQSDGSICHFEHSTTPKKRKGVFAEQESRTKFSREDDMEKEEMLRVDLKKETLSPDATSRGSQLVDKGEQYCPTLKQDIKAGVAESYVRELPYEEILKNIKTEPESSEDLNFANSNVEKTSPKKKLGTPEIGQERREIENKHKNTEYLDYGPGKSLFQDTVSFPQSYCYGKQSHSEPLKENPPGMQTSTMLGSTVQISTATDTTSATTVQSSNKHSSSSNMPIMIKLPDGNVTTVMFPENLIKNNPENKKKRGSAIRSRIHQNVSDVTSPLQFDEFTSKRALPVTIQLPDGKSTTLMVPKELTEGIPYVSGHNQPGPQQFGQLQVPVLNQGAPVSCIPSTQSTGTAMGASTILQNLSQTVLKKTASGPVGSSAQPSSNGPAELSTSTSSSTSVPQNSVPNVFVQNPPLMLSQNEITKHGPCDVPASMSTSSSVSQTPLSRLILQTTGLSAASPVQVTKTSLTDSFSKVSTSTAVGSQFNNSTPNMVFQTSNFPVVSPMQITDPTSVTNNLNNHIILVQQPTSSQTLPVTNSVQTFVSGGQIAKTTVLKKQSTEPIQIKPLQLPVVNQTQVMQPQFPSLYQQILLQPNQPLAVPASYVVNSSPQELLNVPKLPLPGNQSQIRFIQTKDGGPGHGQTVNLSEDFVLSSDQTGLAQLGPPQPVQMFNNVCVKQAGPVTLPVVLGTVKNPEPTSVYSNSKPDWKII